MSDEGNIEGLIDEEEITPEEDSDGNEEQESSLEVPLEESDEDGGLSDRAKEYGLSEEDLKAFGDKAPEMLDKFAEMYDARISELGRGLLSAPKGEEEQPPEEEGGKPSSAAEKLIEAGYDDDALLEVVRGLESQVGELKGNLDSGKAASQEKFAQDLDAFFANPPERFKSVVEDALGGKSVFTLGENTPEKEFAESVVNEMDALHAGYMSQGKEMSLEKIGEKALAIVCRDRIKELAERELAGKIKKRGDSALTEPKAKRGLSPTPNKEVQDVESVMRDFGMIPKGALSDFLN